MGLKGFVQGGVASVVAAVQLTLSTSSEYACNFKAKKRPSLTGGMRAVVSNPADVAMVGMQPDGRLPQTQRRNYKSVFDVITRISKAGSCLTVKRPMIVTVVNIRSDQGSDI
ncbi:mitochondrial uncoupling protein 5-like [Durio zibethinus]|uniref:Mitochondrial uncoupling protein 5-like n=1 Tax=Durio zibethinus TaxID=66656 RepID=A0A6P6B7E4_DURZI|nr:mitochondrial uncoupling protein 5-like [Durio zibethinus]